MNDHFESLLKLAANVSFNKEILSNAINSEDTLVEVDLNCKQLEKLSKKILMLPAQGLFVLFSKYCFHLTPAETESFLEIENAKGYLLYYRKLLSFIIGLNRDKLISDPSMKDACKMALKVYMGQEFYNEDHKIVLLPKIRIGTKRVARRIAVAAIIVVMSFSTIMVANAEFREKVVSWIIETFEKYSIFELKSDNLPMIQELQKYKPNYVPEHFKLTNTTEQPSLILYEYGNENSDSFHILMSLSDTRIYIDTEGVVLEELEMQSFAAYYFEKDNVYHIIFEKDGYHFAVYGTISKSELFKITENIGLK